jgi:hypothetical protein
MRARPVFAAHRDDRATTHTVLSITAGAHSLGGGVLLSFWTSSRQAARLRLAYVHALLRHPSRAAMLTLVGVFADPSSGNPGRQAAAHVLQALKATPPPDDEADAEALALLAEAALALLGSAVARTDAKGMAQAHKKDALSHAVVALKV